MTADSPGPSAGNGMRTAVQFQQRELERLYARLDAIQGRVEQIAVAVAAQGGLYAGRVDMAAVTQRVDVLEAARDRAAGGGTWLTTTAWVGLALFNALVAAGALLVAARAAKLF